MIYKQWRAKDQAADLGEWNSTTETSQLHKLINAECILSEQLLINGLCFRLATMNNTKLLKKWTCNCNYYSFHYMSLNCQKNIIHKLYMFLSVPDHLHVWCVYNSGRVFIYWHNSYVLCLAIHEFLSADVCHHLQYYQHDNRCCLHRDHYLLCKNKLKPMLKIYDANNSLRTVFWWKNTALISFKFTKTHARLWDRYNIGIWTFHANGSFNGIFQVYLVRLVVLQTFQHENLWRLLELYFYRSVYLSVS